MKKKRVRLARDRATGAGGSAFVTSLPAVEEERSTGSTAVRPAPRIPVAALAEAQALAKIGSWHADLRSMRVEWSEENYRIFGMSPEEGGASTEAFFDRVHPEDRVAVNAAFDASMAGCAPFVLDHRLLLPDGTVKWVQERCEIFYDEEGKPLNAVGTTQDITDRKTAEAALQQSQQLLRIAGRVGRIGGWNLDLETSTVSWSDEVCAMHGVPSGYRPSVDAAIDFYAPEYRDEIRFRVKACVGAGTPFDFEAQIINGAGQRVWVRAIGEAQVDRSGAVTGLVGALQNISERMSALEALRESDQRFRLVAQATSDVVWDWNLVTDVCWWGDGLQTNFGYPATERSKSFWSDNIHPEDRQRVLDAVHRAIASGRLWCDEYRFRKADGTYAQVSDRALIAFDGAGRACRMLGAMVDVTQQRALEARLDRAQRLSSLGKLAANMAHEFNNVLMGIQPFVEVIRRVTSDLPRAQDAVARIVQSLKRGKDITQEILRHTRAESVSHPIDVRDWLVDFASQSSALGGDAQPDAKPLLAVAPGHPPLTDATDAIPAPARQRLPGMVLIVDDETAVADGISMLLAAEGVQSVSIFEGGGATAAIERHAPELVLLDIGLPDVSGVEVFQRVHDRWPLLRVVLMTGHYNKSDLGPILELPQVGFLQKPFGAVELLEALQR